MNRELTPLEEFKKTLAEIKKTERDLSIMNENLECHAKDYCATIANYKPRTYIEYYRDKDNEIKSYGYILDYNPFINRNKEEDQIKLMYSIQILNVNNSYLAFENIVEDDIIRYLTQDEIRENNLITVNDIHARTFMDKVAIRAVVELLDGDMYMASRFCNFFASIGTFYTTKEAIRPFLERWLESQLPTTKAVGLPYPQGSAHGRLTSTCPKGKPMFRPTEQSLSRGGVWT